MGGEDRGGDAGNDKTTAQSEGSKKAMHTHGHF